MDVLQKPNDIRPTIEAVIMRTQQNRWHPQFVTPALYKLVTIC